MGVGSFSDTTGSSFRASSTNAAGQTTDTQPCNNFREFCDRSYSNVTEVCAHNSMFDTVGNLASNQEVDVTAQLNDGIRMVQGAAHLRNGTLRYCHTSCNILDAGPMTDHLTKVYDWMSRNPYDVVTILIGNRDNIDVEEFAAPIRDSGLLEYAYTPPKVPMGIDDWPTLGSMIRAGKRAVIFMDYEANQTAVPYILDEFSQLWETPFSPTDRDFPCTVHRPPDLSPDQARERMYMLNHNLNEEVDLFGNDILVPNTALLNVTNNITGPGSLGVTTDQCTSTYDRPPKFLLVDYYNRDDGTVFEVAARHNNVTYTRPCCGSPVSAAAAKHRTTPNDLILSLLVASLASILVTL
ncbi:MAG: hypothetical protein M1837_000388 [Sclerophora amabilis]|nr:MAG: hypothetical protein M1837_000388 [Sclerophora amabilis]